jgi:transposase
MYSIGVDFHKAYSHMTVMDAQGQVVRAGKVPNTAEAVQAFVPPIAMTRRPSSKPRGTGP